MSDEQLRQDRFNNGKQVLDAIDGEAGTRVIESLADIAPELGHQMRDAVDHRITMLPVQRHEAIPFPIERQAAGGTNQPINVALDKWGCPGGCHRRAV